MTVRIGLVGLGEAGAALAEGLTSSSGASVAAFDARGDDPAVRRRAEAAGAEMVPDLASLAGGSRVIICLTSAKVAVPVAQAIAPFLDDQHLYADWNSASPAVKREVADIVAARGTRFVDGAVMGAVPPLQHRVPVLLSGDGATEFGSAVAGLGMNLELLGPEPGQASAVKMLRSLLVKGLEALLLECAVGAHAFGVTNRVLESMNGALPTDDWPTLASYLLQRTSTHGERRAEELRQVARTLETVGLTPLLAEAGAERLQWYVDLDVAPDSEGFDYHRALDALEKARHTGG